MFLYTVSSPGFDLNYNSRVQCIHLLMQYYT